MPKDRFASGMASFFRTPNSDVLYAQDIVIPGERECPAFPWSNLANQRQQIMIHASNEKYEMDGGLSAYP